MHEYVLALLGGALIGGAAGLLLWLNGRIAGISGILSSLLIPGAREVSWRGAFVFGLLAGAALLMLFAPQVFSQLPPPSVGLLIASGLLVGAGTQLSGGCTSGHGVCGTARLSSRSWVATATFLSAGGLTVFVVRHVVGAAS